MHGGGRGTRPYGENRAGDASRPPCAPTLASHQACCYVTLRFTFTLRFTLRYGAPGSITVPRGVSVTHGRNLNVISLHILFLYSFDCAFVPITRTRDAGDHCTAVYARAASDSSRQRRYNPPRSRTLHPSTLAGVYTRGVDPTNPHGDGLPAPSPPRPRPPGMYSSMYKAKTTLYSYSTQ